MIYHHRRQKSSFLTSTNARNHRTSSSRLEKIPEHGQLFTYPSFDDVQKETMWSFTITSSTSRRTTHSDKSPTKPQRRANDENVNPSCVRDETAKDCTCDDPVTAGVPVVVAETSLRDISRMQDDDNKNNHDNNDDHDHRFCAAADYARRMERLAAETASRRRDRSGRFTDANLNASEATRYDFFVRWSYRNPPPPPSTSSRWNATSAGQGLDMDDDDDDDDQGLICQGFVRPSVVPYCDRGGRGGGSDESGSSCGWDLYFPVRDYDRRGRWINNNNNSVCHTEPLLGPLSNLAVTIVALERARENGDDDDDDSTSTLTPTTPTLVAASQGVYCGPSRSSLLPYAVYNNDKNNFGGDGGDSTAGEEVVPVVMNDLKEVSRRDRGLMDRLGLSLCWHNLAERTIDGFRVRGCCTTL